MKINIEDNNLLDYTSWSGLTSGDIIDDNGSYWNDYALGTTVNTRIIDTDPFGNDAVVWQASGGTGASNYGGFNAWTGQHQYINCDPSKDYRFSIWVNRKIYQSTKPGDSYFGLWATSGTTRQNITNKQTGILTNNAYFTIISPAISNTYLPADTWRLLVGYIYNSGTTTGSTSNGGLYYMDGTRITGSSDGVYTYDFINNPLVTDLTMRIMIPYNSSGYICHYVYPRIDEINGTEPSISTLLSNEGNWRNVNSSGTYINLDNNKIEPLITAGITGSTDGYFTLQSNGINYTESNIDPYGNNNTVWVSSSSGFTNLATLGYYISSAPHNITINTASTYRISFWVKYDGDTENNLARLYIRMVSGTTQLNVTNINNNYTGISPNNIWLSPNTLPKNEWLLHVYHVHPQSYTGSNHVDTGVWRLNGDKISLSGTSSRLDTRIPIETDKFYLLNHFIYGTCNVKSEAYGQRVDEINGTEPSIQSLLNNEGNWKKINNINII